MGDRTGIRSAGSWAGTAAAATTPLALLVMWVELRWIAALWRECGLDDASGGVGFNFVVFPVTVFVNALLVPIAALLFAGCRRVVVRLVDKGWALRSALASTIPVGVLLALAAGALVPVLAFFAANAQIPPDYPTSCAELGDGNAGTPR
ncbi:hypothetical protein ABT324_08405 [Saccharopolyspora sp. NPDC000359]|uniref:hypothetical protein n=1 Tax=Saccharopolyspora sp. NPDC000359 TaxID=3154251 RepID=UPI003320E5CC